MDNRIFLTKDLAAVEETVGLDAKIYERENHCRNQIGV